MTHQDDRMTERDATYLAALLAVSSVVSAVLLVGLVSVSMAVWVWVGS